MKTPEELAVEYADRNSGGECSNDWNGLVDGFLAGYQAAAPQWISVKDRLPEDNGPILMWSGRLEHVPTCAAAGYELWNWSTEYSPHDFRLHEITHWMPLPKAPKE
jgi:hypothetical protein